MATPEIERRVKKIVAEQLCVHDHDVTLASTLESLGADSLDRIEIVMALEEEFELEISDEDGETLTDVQKALDYIGRRLSKSK